MEMLPADKDGNTAVDTVSGWPRSAPKNSS